MKNGRYFRIPERPADLERLWHEAAPLAADTRPGWLRVEDAAGYRYVGAVPAGGVPAPERTAYLAELAELERAGLIAEEDATGCWLHHVFVPKGEYEVWSIGIYAGRSPVELAPAVEAANPVLTREDVSDVPAVFVADPFMVRVNNAWYLFFEVMNWRTGKGEIGLATSPDGLTWTYRQIVLAEAFHLSYPYVFESAGDYYLIPESYQARSIRLYRATRFPTEWSLVETLLTGPYFADGSVCVHDGRWWLFAETNPAVTHDTLRLYHADDLAGPWREHPKSPVVRGDGRRARPAGRVLVLDDRIIRYAQDCVPHYGTAVRAFEILALSTIDYRERELHQRPILAGSGAGWNASGMHHVDPHPIADGRWIACVDGWRSPGGS